MQVTTTTVGKANSKLAQFKKALENSEIKSNQTMKWVLDKLENVNYKVLATDYLQLSHADWVGNTALHFAAIHLHSEYFEMLLAHGAGFTIKNNRNLTALHQVLVIKAPSISETLILDDPLIDLVLSAHIKYQNFENPSNDNGLSHFHIACAANNLEAVKGFVRNGVSVHQTVKAECSLFSGFSPLHFVAKYSAFDVAEFLVSYGANMNIKDSKLMTPVQLALEQKLKIASTADKDKLLREKNDSILKLFVEKESNDDMMTVSDLGLSHFHIASTLDDSTIARNYLDRIVNINDTVNIDSPLWGGYSALHFAALCNLETVKLIMKKGGDINIKDAKGYTPFSMCIEKYNIQDVYEILCLHPIWKNIVLSDDRTKLIDLVFAMKSLDNYNNFFTKSVDGIRIYFNSPLWPGFTPLHLAVIFTNNTEKNENLQILKKLLEQNTSMIYSQDVHGRTPLHLAFYYNKKSVLDVFLHFLDSRPTWVNCTDENGLSYMHIASAQNNITLLERMLPIGSNANAVYKGKEFHWSLICSGSTALHFAVVNGSTKAVEMLVKKGASVCIKDEYGMTPIHRLFSNFDHKSAGFLFSSPNLKDSVVDGIGLSHLHVACRSLQPQYAESLLNKGADINGLITYQPNKNGGLNRLPFCLEKYVGCSPLSIAYEEGREEIMELLLLAGADAFVQNSKGKALLYSFLEKDTYFRSSVFLDFLKDSDELQARLKAETGMPALHIACLVNNYEAIVQLISEGVDVNEQIRSDSPVFPGYTPLNILVYFSTCLEVDEAIQLLLNKRADVTIANAVLDTPIHVVCNMLDAQEEMAYPRLTMMLEAQRDFSLNPTNASGMSHFHIACGVFNASVVFEFLDNSKIDIDRPVDGFHHDFSGYTALHLATMGLIEVDSDADQLETIDLLLKHKANVHIEDVHCDTALFNCFGVEPSLHSIDHFERIARAGADVNERNLTGNTPISDFLDSDEVTDNGVKALLRLGCRLNLFNTFTDYGYIAKLFRHFNFEKLSMLFSVLIPNFAQELAVDDIGRTAIHNIVSNDGTVGLANECATYIEQLSKLGCDIDDQDNLGRTALHFAAKFYNATGISGLLMTGADINIRDNNGKTIMFFEFDRCSMCEIYERYNNSEDYKCNHYQTLETFAKHVKKLQMCGVDVSKESADFACEAFRKLNNTSTLMDGFLTELDIIRATYIGSLSLTLFEFLSETGAISRYPRMSIIERNVIHKFFSVKNIPNIRKQFPESAGILQLQYRKARIRPQLVELARNVWVNLVGYNLPVICSDLICEFLSNDELKNIIAAKE